MSNVVKTDIILKDFWRQNDRFADLFNAVVFGGKEVIKPEELQEMDTDMAGIIRFKDYEEAVVRVRDVVKKTVWGIEFAVLGIENQKHVHYAMPLRTMLYDGLGYLKEYQEITHLRKNDKKKKTEDEFLSRMRKEDRLHPIISIIIYYGEEEWDGPLSLKDMIVEMPEEINNIFSDYTMNLVQVRDSGRYIFHNDDVRTVFEISQSIFRKDFRKIQQKYGDRDIAAELIRVIGKITETTGLIHQVKNEEVMNMCTALEELVEEGVRRKEESIISKLLGKGFKPENVADMLDVELSKVLEVQRGLTV